jgi:hypothetical protein
MQASDLLPRRNAHLKIYFLYPQMFLIDYTLTESYQNNSKSIKCIALQSALIRSGNPFHLFAPFLAYVAVLFQTGRICKHLTYCRAVTPKMASAH